jgi:chromosome segregation ATPase
LQLPDAAAISQHPLRADLELARSEAASLSSRLEAATAECGELGASLEATKKLLTQSNFQAARLEADRKAALKAAQVAETDLRSSQFDVKILLGRVETLQCDNRNWRSHRELLEEALAALTAKGG